MKPIIRWIVYTSSNILLVIFRRVVCIMKRKKKEIRKSGIDQQNGKA
jgi:hypothetical protein